MFTVIQSPNLPELAQKGEKHDSHKLNPDIVAELE